MSDWKKFDSLLEGEIQVSLLNEPIVDFVIDHEVKAEGALKSAQRRWQYAELINGDQHER